MTEKWLEKNKNWSESKKFKRPSETLTNTKPRSFCATFWHKWFWLRPFARNNCKTNCSMTLRNEKHDATISNIIPQNDYLQISTKDVIAHLARVSKEKNISLIDHAKRTKPTLINYIKSSMQSLSMIVN